MIKFITLRIFRWKLRNTLPKINTGLYKKLFNLTYKFFIFLKPSQIWIIILALLNKTEFKNVITVPSIFILFSTLFSDINGPEINQQILNERLEINKFTDSDNKWENFFWVLIILAILKRFITKLFKVLWIPFKIAFIFYILKYFGFDFSYIFNILNNLSLGIIEWFYDKITDFFNLIFNNNNDNKSN